MAFLVTAPTANGSTLLRNRRSEWRDSMAADISDAPAAIAGAGIDYRLTFAAFAGGNVYVFS